MFRYLSVDLLCFFLLGSRDSLPLQFVEAGGIETALRLESFEFALRVDLVSSLRHVLWNFLIGLLGSSSL